MHHSAWNPQTLIPRQAWWTGKTFFHKTWLKWPWKTKKASKYKGCWVFFCKLKMHFYGLEKTKSFFFVFFFPLGLNVMENYLNYLFSAVHISYLFDMSIDHYFYNPLLLLWFICILFVSCTWSRLDKPQVLRSLFYFSACQEHYIILCPSPLLLDDAIRFSYAALKIALMSQFL